MKKQKNRQTEIIDILSRDGGASINRLSGDLGVSHMTIRRDLDGMEEDGLIDRFHGSVVLKSPMEGSWRRYALNEASTRSYEEKQRIGSAAAGLLRDGDVISIDAGSTTEQLARSLPAEMSLSIICYTLNTLMIASRRDDCRIVFGGGYYHQNTMMFESSEGLELIRKNRATRAFLSASGIDSRLGVTCANPYERETKRAVMESSGINILLADSGKFRGSGGVWFADISDFDMVITDKSISPEDRSWLEKSGVDVLYV
jgi:DeoR family deoxyribose operon repressor